MLPLWPETLYVGLYPGLCTLQRGSKVPVQAWQTPSTFDFADVLSSLEKTLDAQMRPVRKGARLVVTVSDSIAAIAPLPWQETLTHSAEIDSYAHICYEKLGMTIDEKWIMRAEFRHFNGMGLAYALPRAWIDAMLGLVQAKGFQLAAILPLSAAAYFRQPAWRKSGSTVLILQEENRMSAMVYGKDGLLTYDVEPHARSRDETLLRLLRRVASEHSNVTRVSCWANDFVQSSAPTELMSACFPECEFDFLQYHAWN